MSAIVIITGASSGLGHAMANAVPFTARVIDISRSGPPEGGGIEHISADLADPNSWSEVATRIATAITDSGPNRSVFIHSAGTLTPIGHVSSVDEAAYTDNVLLNSAAGQVVGMAYIQAVTGLPGVHDLVMVSSGAATNSYPGWAAYGAGKAALDQWVRTVGLEQKIHGGVRVSSIAPGVIDTRMQAEIRSTDQLDFPDVKRFHRLKEEGRLKSPQDAATMIWNKIESGLESGSVVDIRSD